MVNKIPFEIYQYSQGKKEVRITTIYVASQYDSIAKEIDKWSLETPGVVATLYGWAMPDHLVPWFILRWG